ncbi:MAG: tRNA (adenosine(37)-N6)-threonylcarbamoyltransferase complex ATPase subunit type 1 TsaE [Patescibacteria group bacterium]
MKKENNKISNGVNQIITNSEKETLTFGKNYGGKLKSGEIIGLVGNLGAGKTILAKGVAFGLGIKKNVNSPTFTVMKVYPAKKGEIKTFIHIDAYRLSSEKDLIALGAEEYFNDPSAVILIEWADKVKKILPQRTNYINIKILEDNKREIKLN